MIGIFLSFPGDSNVQTSLGTAGLGPNKLVTLESFDRLFPFPLNFHPTLFRLICCVDPVSVLMG